MGLETSDIFKRIRFIRGKRTQEEFGNLIGVTKAAISKYESGRIPNPLILKKIAEIGQTTVGWILLGDRADILAEVRQQTLDEFLGPDLSWEFKDIALKNYYDTAKRLYEENMVLQVENQRLREIQSGIIINPEFRILTKEEARREFGFLKEKDYYRAVPVLTDPIAAGPPRPVTPEDYSDFIIMFAGWTPENSIAFRIKGDSMIPLLQNGDLVGLSPWQGDFTDLKQQRGKIMAFWLPEPDAGLTVKRLNIDSRHLILEPLNPAYLNIYVELSEIDQLQIFTINWWCCHHS